MAMCPGRSQGCKRGSMPDGQYLCMICASKVAGEHIERIGALIDSGDKAGAQAEINSLLAYLATV